MSPTHSLKSLVRLLTSRGPLRTLPTTKRIRLLFNSAFIADTTSALYVWEHEFYPQLYLPMQAFINATGFDVKLGYGDAITDESGKVVVGGEVKLAARRKDSGEEWETLDDMVLFAADLEGPGRVLRDYVKVVFDSVDQWFEEDAPIHVHPKDPYKRIDVLPSSRPIRITLPNHTSTNTTNGATTTSTPTILAESTHAMHLHETGLPPRYYLPYTSLRTIYLRDSDTITECPYKGVANYHHVLVDGVEYTDLVWWYPLPTAECMGISGMRCFYGEKVDVWIKDGSAGVVDGGGGGEWKLLERPRTHFA